MKKVILTVALVALMASSSFAEISGSKHDFNLNGSFTPDSQICVACHTPHQGKTTGGTDAPLWNHAETTATYTVYAGPGTLNATVGQPTGVSKLCLSCHDGQVALDSFGASTAGVNFLTGAANLIFDGTASLTNDHPISFTYDAGLVTADGGVGLWEPTTTLSGLGLNIDDDMLFGAGNDQLECASCHDVHNGANIPKMLVKANTGSALCLTCHRK